MDIGKNSTGVASRLSNFTARNFVVTIGTESLACASMEGFLQALKYENPDAQRITAMMVGYAAKKKGRSRNRYWQSKQTLWWNAEPILRNSKAYSNLITAAYDAMYMQSESLRNDLKTCKGVNFTHSIGNNDERQTVLTEREFCAQLRRLRDKALNES